MAGVLSQRKIVYGSVQPAGHGTARKIAQLRNMGHKKYVAIILWRSIDMEHTTVNCSSCNKELHIKVAAGFKAPDLSMCKACSQGKPKTPQKVTMNLGEALKIAAGAKRVMRGTHREKNLVL